MGRQKINYPHPLTLSSETETTQALAIFLAKNKKSPSLRAFDVLEKTGLNEIEQISRFLYNQK